MGHLIENDDELVASNSGYHIAPAHGATESLGHLDQQCIAGGVSQCIVYDLESIKVDEQNRAFAAITAG
jgi:hypothetical protein